MWVTESRRQGQPLSCHCFHPDQNWFRTRKMKIVATLAALCLIGTIASAQRYVDRYDRVRRPKPVVDSEFTSAKSKVSLSCETGKMMLKMTFVEPFGGVVQIGPKNTKECTLRGNRTRKSYVFTVSPDACGACKGHSCAPGTFVNTMYIRYHPTLEREGDDVKTVICKYQAGSIQAG